MLRRRMKGKVETMPKTLDDLRLLDLAHHLERQPETASPGEVRRLAEYVREHLERPPQVTVPDGSVLRGELRFTQDVSPYPGSPIQLAPEGAEMLDLGGGVDADDLLYGPRITGGELRLFGAEPPPPDGVFRLAEPPHDDGE